MAEKRDHAIELLVVPMQTREIHLRQID